MKLSSNLTGSLKELADQGPIISAAVTSFAAEQPDLYKTVIEKIGTADKPGIRPTVSEAKDPASCKYTEEGTMIHEVMQRIATADRRVKALSDLEVTLTTADKAAMIESAKTNPKAAGLKMLELEFPDKVKVFA